MRYKSLEISEEEKEAIVAYCGQSHFYANIMGQGDIQQIEDYRRCS